MSVLAVVSFMLFNHKLTCANLVPLVFFAFAAFSKAVHYISTWNLPLDKNGNISLLDGGGLLVSTFKCQQCTLDVEHGTKKSSRGVFLRWATQERVFVYPVICHFRQVIR